MTYDDYMYDVTARHQGRETACMHSCTAVNTCERELQSTMDDDENIEAGAYVCMYVRGTVQGSYRARALVEAGEDGAMVEDSGHAQPLLLPQ